MVWLEVCHWNYSPLWFGRESSHYSYTHCYLVLWSCRCYTTYPPDAHISLLGECAARILTITIPDSSEPLEESGLTALSEHHAPCKGQSQLFPRSDVNKFHLSLSSTVVSASFAVMWKLVNLPHQWVVSLLSLFFRMLSPRLSSFSSFLNKTFPCCRKEKEDNFFQGSGGS